MPYTDVFFSFLNGIKEQRFARSSGVTINAITLINAQLLGKKNNRIKPIEPPPSHNRPPN
jgi:hypothetical protein